MTMDRRGQFFFHLALAKAYLARAGLAQRYVEAIAADDFQYDADDEQATDSFLHSLEKAALNMMGVRRHAFYGFVNQKAVSYYGKTGGEYKADYPDSVKSDIDALNTINDNQGMLFSLMASAEELVGNQVYSELHFKGKGK